MSEWRADGAVLVDRIEGDPVWKARDSATLFVVSSYEKSWIAREADRREGFERPGACIGWVDDNYEVREILREEGTGRFVYRLEPWDDRHSIQRILPHDAVHHREEIQERRADLRRHRLLYPVLYLAYPALGLLPASVQMKLQNEYGLDARAMSSISAMTTFAAAGLFCARQIAQLEFTWLFFVCFALLLEALIRFQSTWKTEEPIGSAPVWFVFGLVDMVRLEARAGRRRQEGHLDAVSRRRRAELVSRMDLIQPRADGGITVKSFATKAWTEGTTVRYDGRFFSLTDHREEETSDGRLYVYELPPADLEGIFRRVVDFTPDEGLRSLQEEERELQADRLNILGPILGLLPESIQTEWAATGFMPFRAVRQSAFLFGLGAAIHLAFRLQNPTSAPALDTVELVVATYLLLESLVRGYRVAYGEITGSLLGLPLAGLVRLRRRLPQAAPPE